jgi:hypothetical protein
MTIPQTTDSYRRDDYRAAYSQYQQYSLGYLPWRRICVKIIVANVAVSKAYVTWQIIARRVPENGLDIVSSGSLYEISQIIRYVIDVNVIRVSLGHRET